MLESDALIESIKSVDGSPMLSIPTPNEMDSHLENALEELLLDNEHGSMTANLLPTEPPPGAPPPGTNHVYSCVHGTDNAGIPRSIFLASTLDPLSINQDHLDSEMVIKEIFDPLADEELQDMAVLPTFDDVAPNVD